MRIKGNFLALVLCAVTMAPLQAQLTVGGLLDFNIAGISVNPDVSTEDYSSYLGFGLGGIATYQLMNGLALQTEPMLLRKGAKVTEFDQTIKLKLLYIEIPVFLRYNIALDGAVLPYAILGPNLGFRVSAKAAFPDGSTGDISDEISGIDFGLGLGAGAEYPYNQLIFFAETRYVFGLNDINLETDESSVKNHGLQILLGVKVPVGE